MKRTLIIALLPLAATSLVVTGGATTSGAAVPETNGRCTLPTAERSYTRDQLVYRLAMDVTDCDWWDGSPVQLDGTIERVDPTAGGHGTGSFVLCGALIPSDRAISETDAADPTGSAESDEPVEDQATAKPPAGRTSSTGLRSGACAVEVSIDHPSPEAAHYTGEITFPWQGGRRTVSFNALCGGNAGGCVDLPFNPMATLAPIGEAIVGIGDAG